jgi:hypothetical protein
MVLVDKTRSSTKKTAFNVELPHAMSESLLVKLSK